MKIEFKQLNELAQKKAEKLLKEISLTVKDVLKSSRTLSVALYAT